MLRIPLRSKVRKMSKAMGRTEDGHGLGPVGRINKLRKLVTAVVRHERIEGNYQNLDEARPYVDLLILKAQRYGDKHKATMELADYWLEDKDLVHKLFKVLAPRFQEFPESYTKIYRLPTEYPGFKHHRVGLLELRGNPWPPVVPKERDFSNTLTNILLTEARLEFQQKKKMANKQSSFKGRTNQNQSVQENLTEKLSSLGLEETGGNISVSKDGTPV